MSAKEELLARLEARRGAWVSGGALSQELGVSRSALWKAVEALKREGYPLEAQAGKGYRLPAGAARLSAQGIALNLAARDFYRITVARQVDSTNLRAKALAAQGEAEGAVVVAEAQTAGRGRMGRAFYSPSRDGFYLSILLRPSIPATQALCLTTAAAVAVCQALETVCGLSPKIKWVNDVLVEGKKVCGILTEAQVNLENGELDYAVVGIGINVELPEGGYPPELASIAGALYPRGGVPDGLRNRLAAGVLDHFYRQYRAPAQAHLADYRARSGVLGKAILVMDPGLGSAPPRPATALAIQDDFGLLVEFQDGTRQVLSSGEVSTRLRSGGA